MVPDTFVCPPLSVLSGDAANTYKSFDGRDTYVISGTDLIVDGVLTVNANFQSGQFGIQSDHENKWEPIARLRKAA